MENNNNTYDIKFWSRFVVKSYGVYDEEKGYVSNKNDVFDPSEISDMLNITPEHICVYGERKEGISNPQSVYLFSGWFSPKIKEPPIERGDHANAIIKMLSPYEKELRAFKKRNNVLYEINFTIYDGYGDDIIIDNDTIAFCSRLSIEIRFTTFLMNEQLKLEDI